MEIISTKKEGGSTFITVKISSSEGASFLEKEESLADLLNEVGLLATDVLLSEVDVAESVIEVEQERYYRKGSQKKPTKRPTDV